MTTWRLSRSPLVQLKMTEESIDSIWKTCGISTLLFTGKGRVKQTNTTLSSVVVYMLTISRFFFSSPESFVQRLSPWNQQGKICCENLRIYKEESHFIPSCNTNGQFSLVYTHCTSTGAEVKILERNYS